MQQPQFPCMIEHHHCSACCYHKAERVGTDMFDSHRQLEIESSHCSGCCYRKPKRVEDESWLPIRLTKTAAIILSGATTEQQRVQASGDNPVTRLEPPFALTVRVLEFRARMIQSKSRCRVGAQAAAERLGGRRLEGGAGDKRRSL